MILPHRVGYAHQVQRNGAEGKELPRLMVGRAHPTTVEFAT